MFLSAYDWFVKAAEAHIPKPQGAEYPYWAFGSPENVDLSFESKSDSKWHSENLEFLFKYGKHYFYK